MKNLKLKSIVFSLMAIIVVTVFLSSCEKNQMVPNTLKEVNNEINESAISDSENIVYELPEQFNSMSEEELIAFFKSTDISTLGIPASTQELESRGVQCSAEFIRSYSIVFQYFPYCYKVSERLVTCNDGYRGIHKSYSNC